MRSLIIVLLLLSASTELVAQRPRSFNVYFQLAPTLTLDTRFANGSTTYVSPLNNTGTNTIYPLYSVLDGRPNPDMTFFQNFARKFSWSILVEEYINERYSVNTGFEIGARGYKVISSNSVSSLISFRNLAVPVYFSRYRWLGAFWTLKFNYGGMLNYSWSIERDDRVAKIKRNPVFYPLLGGGIELAYMGKDGKLSFDFGYYKGWQNIIDHVYIGVDNNKGERITTTGSHLRIGIKYNFRRFERTRREKKLAEITDETENVQDFSSRLLKTPHIMIVAGDSVMACFTDDQTVDGDSILVVYNGEIVASAINLSKAPLCLKLPILPGSNTLVIHALNEGKIKPNTYQVNVTDARGEQMVRLKSDMSTSARIALNTHSKE